MQVRIALNDENVRPVADRVHGTGSEIVPYEIDAMLYCFPGPEIEPVTCGAEEKLKILHQHANRLGRDIRLSAIYAALHVEGVQRVELAQHRRQTSCLTTLKRHLLHRLRD